MAVERLRYQLPVNLYLDTLHDAAAYGYMKVYDQNGRVTEIRAVSDKLRLDSARYLTDKVMPSTANVRIETDSPDSPEEAMTKLDTLSPEELHALAYGQMDAKDVSDSAEVHPQAGQ